MTNLIGGKHEIFSEYTENNHLELADIFHIYDTGKNCKNNFDGYFDCKHFELWAFNTQKKEKCYCGLHDELITLASIKINFMVRVYEDGAFLIKFSKPLLIHYFSQSASLETKKEI